MKQAFGFGDGEVIDARVSNAHEPVFVEFPVLVSVRTMPLASLVMRLIGETDSNASFTVGPKLFDEPIVQLFRPLAPQECHDGIPADKELRAIAPTRIGRVGKRDCLWISRVPRILCFAHLDER